MTLVVARRPRYRAERRYVLGVVLGEWLGLDWRLEPRTGTPTCGSASTAPTTACVSLPDVLFARDRTAG